MSTVIIPELSKKNKYWISKHRYYELKHFCLQYPEWKQRVLYLETRNFPGGSIVKTFESRATDPTADTALQRLWFAERINLVDKTAYIAGGDIYKYLHKSVTEGVGFNYLKSFMNIPCGKDLFLRSVSQVLLYFVQIAVITSSFMKNLTYYRKEFIMSIEELKVWIEERLKASQKEVNLAYDEWDKIPNGEKTMEGWNKVTQFRALRDEIQIIKSKIDEVV